MSLYVAVTDERMRQRLEPQIGSLTNGGDVELVVWTPGDAPLGRMIDLLVMPYTVTYESLSSLGGLVHYIQGQSLGFDGAEQFIPDGVVYSNAVGVHEAPTAEMAMTLILASQRGWPEVGQNQADHNWKRAMWPGLIGARVLLIGVGGIGGEFEKRITGFGVELTRVARTARGDIHSIDDLPKLLPDADIVVLAIPLNSDTTGLVDGDFLDLLPQGALVVNVSRGPIVDTDALVERVRTGAIRTALDVVDPEPLPSDYPLWSLPGSLIAPHLGGAVRSMSTRVDPLVLTQIDLLLRGERPKDIVIDKE
jgi:phosphoglycerate dehydrogenase-like enzyme